MPADADQRLKVFISYARGDLAFADQLFAALDAAGFEPMLDRHGITAGADFQQRLGAMILEADTVVFVLSPASVNPKSYTIWEIGEAERLSKRILPIVCSPIDNIDVPDRLKRLDYPFFYDEPKMPESGFGKAMKRLTTALNSDLEWLREHTRLLELASEWNVKRTPEHLLRGQLIAEAQKWMLSKPRTAPDVTPLHLEFIKASEAAQSLLDNEARQQIERIAAAQTEQAKALARAEEAVKERERVTDERDTAKSAAPSSNGSERLFQRYSHSLPQLWRRSRGTVSGAPRNKSRLHSRPRRPPMISKNSRMQRTPICAPNYRLCCNQAKRQRAP